MGVNYATAVADNRLKVVNDAVNSKTYADGTGAGAAGKLVIGTSALSGATGVLATINLQNPAFTEANKTLTLAGVPLSSTATGAGQAAKAEIRNNADAVIVSGLTVNWNTALAITSISWASGMAVATVAAHGLTVGSQVNITVSGATPAGYNGTYVATVTSATTLSYPVASNPGACTVPGSYLWNADVMLNSLTVAVGQTVQVTSGTITHP